VGKIVNGQQTSRQYDHIALDVTNPMQDIGIQEGDVRMESKLPENFRIEETPTIEGDREKEPAKEPEKDREFWIEYGRKLARLEQLEQEKTKPAVEETTEETSPAPEPDPELEPRKAKTVVPQGAASKKDTADEDGQFRIVVGQEK